MQLDQFSDEITVEYLVTKKFLTADEFSQYIEQEAIRRNITNYEMLVEHCEERNVDPVFVASTINERLKELVRVEAEKRNLMKEKKGTLPL